MCNDPGWNNALFTALGIRKPAQPQGALPTNNMASGNTGPSVMIGRKSTGSNLNFGSTGAGGRTSSGLGGSTAGGGLNL